MGDRQNDCEDLPERPRNPMRPRSAGASAIACWCKPQRRRGITERPAPEDPAFERHYRIGELAETWQLGRETVRRLVKDEPGVIKIRLGRKKAHTIYPYRNPWRHHIHSRSTAAILAH